MENVAGEDVDIWDLDHTIFNTDWQWFGPMISDVAVMLGLDRERVDQAFTQGMTSFTWEGAFAAIDLEQSRWEETKRDLLHSLATRAESCVYPGVVDLIRRRHRARKVQVLVTAGDIPWQQWKFEQLRSLHDLFAPDHRHFVEPNGSKGERVHQYRKAASLKFVDDRPEWHLEVAARVPGVTHIRPVWANTHCVQKHEFDSDRWTVVTSIAELEECLR